MNILANKANARKKLYVALIAASLTLVGCSDKVADNAKLAEIHQKTSASYMKQGQYRAAIIEARNVIKYSPNSVEGYLALTRIYSKLGNNSAVINDLEPLLSDYASKVSLPLAKAYSMVGKYHSALKTLDNTDQSSTEALLVRAFSLAGLKRVDEAEKIYTALLLKDASNTDAQLSFIKLQLQTGKQQQAAAALDNILQQESNNPEALFLKAQIAYLSNDLNSTENYLTEALQNLPNTDIMAPLKIKVLSQLAQTLTQLGRTTESMVYTKILADANPEAHQARQQFNEALNLYQTGELERAEELLIGLYEDNPSNNMNGMLLGLINLQQGDLEEAGKLLEENIDAETASSQAISSTALAQLRLKKPGQAVELLEKALVSHPEDANILAIYGFALLTIDDNDARAALALQKALAIDPERYKAHTLLARHFLAIGKNEKAYAQFNIALDKAPKDQAIRDGYINALLRNSEQQKALQLADSFIKQSPEDPNVYLQAAKINVASKDLAAAEKNLSKTISLDRNNATALLGLGQLQLIDKQWTKASDNFRKALAEEPSVGGYKGLITGQQALKQGKEIISELTKEATTNPANNTLHAVLAEYFAREDQADMALQFAASSTNTLPISNYARSTAISIYRTLSKRLLVSAGIDEARSQLTPAIELAPNNTTLLGELINIEVQGKNYSEAIKIADQIEQIEQGAAIGKYFKGQIYTNQQQWPEAISHLKAAWKIQPNNAIAATLFGALNANNDKDKAMLFVDEWQRLIPLSPTPLIIKATQQQQQGKALEAIELFEKAISLSPNNAIALNNLAWLYFENGNSKARELGNRAYELAPNSPAIMDTYGWILVNDGSITEGIKLLEQAVAAGRASGADTAEIEAHLEAARTKQ
ncbi:MAG: tetratricopeptide (TPR) repeat protein [Oceanicoccus sp.]|jgi:tetratricopeptide (TPR) repeat protein